MYIILIFLLLLQNTHIELDGLQEQGKMELSPSDDFIRRDITAVGSWFYHFSEYPKMLELTRQGLRVRELITHRLPLAQAGEGFALMARGKTGKVILEY